MTNTAPKAENEDESRFPPELRRSETEKGDASFRWAIYTDPDDDTPRLVYADWLDEGPDPSRAEYIRLECELARGVSDPTRRTELEERSAHLLTRHAQEWKMQEFPPDVTTIFRRGFVEEIWMSARSTSRPAPRTKSGIFPMRGLKISDLAGGQLPPNDDYLQSSQHRAELRHLGLRGDEISVIQTLRGMDFSNLHTLNIAYTRLGYSLNDLRLPKETAHIRRLFLTSNILLDTAMLANILNSENLKNVDTIDLSWNSLGTQETNIAPALSDRLRRMRHVAISSTNSPFPPGRGYRPEDLLLAPNAIETLNLSECGHPPVFQHPSLLHATNLREWNVANCGLTDKILLDLLEHPQFAGVRMLNICRNPGLTQTCIDTLQRSRPDVFLIHDKENSTIEPPRRVMPYLADMLRELPPQKVAEIQRINAQRVRNITAGAMELENRFTPTDSLPYGSEAGNAPLRARLIALDYVPGLHLTPQEQWQLEEWLITKMTNRPLTNM